MTDIIVTIGPSSLNNSTIKSIIDSGASDLRINLSHSDHHSLEEYYTTIKKSGITPSFDTQGAQIRISGFKSNLQLSLNSSVVVCSEPIPDKNYITINHTEVFKQIETGDLLKVDFEGLVLCVTDVFEAYFECTVIAEGKLALNKAIDIHNSRVKLSPFTDFDFMALKNYINEGISSIYVSFTNSANDIRQLSDFLDSLKISDYSKRPLIIAKIESKLGIYNLNSILDEVDGVLIDRGDLSREISISRIPLATKSIIQSCNKRNIPCYVATNILDSMIINSLPSRAEISDLYNLLDSKVSGIVLAAECAIGKHPVESVQVINHIARVHEAHQSGTLELLPSDMFCDSLPPHLSSWL